MFSSASSSMVSNRVAVTTFAVGAALFNTHTPINIDDVMSSQNEVVYATNLVDGYWSSHGETFQAVSFDAQAELRGMSDIINDVKIFLGLPNKDVAEILGVTRQTLHAYKSGAENDHKISQNTLDRAFLVDSLVEKARGLFERSPGAMSKNFMYEGKSLLSLLTEKDIDQDKFVSVAGKLADKMQGHSAHLTQTHETTLFQMTSSS
ncbi:hypothetical protein [Marinomonas flavescens]|uniref:hypothetical protein n=1 Tax=Marinomonas flavescens TaxID=2529379 RepID=UPI001054E5B2|nr:hypothetical protein [Marinomonas flavescens]